MDQSKTSDTGSGMPVSALSADSRVESILVKIENTPTGGRMLGILKPIWTKALESEKRLAWLLDMVVMNIKMMNNQTKTAPVFITFFPTFSDPK